MTYRKNFQSSIKQKLLSKYNNISRTFSIFYPKTRQKKGFIEILTKIGFCVSRFFESFALQNLDFAQRFYLASSFEENSSRIVSEDELRELIGQNKVDSACLMYLTQANEKSTLIASY